MKRVLVAVVCVSSVFADKKLIESVYQGVSGFGISEAESLFIRTKGGEPTYGEITYEGFETIVKDIHLTKKDVFYDLGCGVGKVVVQVYDTTPVKKAVGIELSSTRCASATRAKQELVHRKKIARGRKLLFQEGDISAANVSDATVIFMCSTCFSDELMQKLTNKFARLKKGLRVLTLRRLPENASFELIHTYQVPMTWSASSSVYLYKKC